MTSKRKLYNGKHNLKQFKIKKSRFTNIDWTSESDWSEAHWVFESNGPLWLNISSTGGTDDENDNRHKENHPNDR